MKDTQLCSFSDLEKQIFEKEGVTVVFRTKSSDSVSPYSFERKLADNKNITDLKDRIDRTLNKTNSNVEYSIILGDGNSLPHGRTNMNTARNSYKN